MIKEIFLVFCVTIFLEQAQKEQSRDKNDFFY